MLIAVILGIAGQFSLRNNLGFTFAALFITVYMFVVYANAFDYKYEGDMVMNSLPVALAQVVAAQYLSVFIFFLFGVAVAALAAFLTRLLGIASLARILEPGFAALQLAFAFVYFSLYFPLYFKLGYMRSRWVNFLLLFAISGSAGAVMGRGGGGARLSAEQLKSALWILKDTAFPWVALLAATLLMLASLGISVQVYSR